MVHVYSSWFWMAILLWMRTAHGSKDPFRNPSVGRPKEEIHHIPPVFWGLVPGRWDWKWLEKMMELKMLHWGMLEWLFWRVTIRIRTKTSPPRHLHTPKSSRFVFLPVTWKTSWEKVHETNRTQWKLILSVIEDCVMWYTSILVMVRNTEPKSLILGDGWWQCGSNLYMRIWWYIYIS